MPNDTGFFWIIIHFGHTALHEPSFRLERCVPDAAIQRLYSLSKKIKARFARASLSALSASAGLEVR